MSGSPAAPSGAPNKTNQQLQPVGLLDLGSIASLQYSPLTLRHLPQPVPQDAPAHMDKSVFTFEDAFEDLLAVTAGAPLPDIQQKFSQRQLLRQMFPSGEPAIFWHRRLQASGLVSGWQRNRLDGTNSPWGHLHDEISRQIPDVWERVRELSEKTFEDADPLGSLMELGDQIARGVPKVFGGDRTEREDASREPRQADNTDELFLSSIQDTADSGRRSWDTLVKHIAGAHDEWHGQKRPQLPEPSKTTIEESREEQVDRFGYVHSTVIRKELDSNGNEVGRSTMYQMYPAPADRKEAAHDQVIEYGSDENKDSKGKEGKPEEGASGWFWK